MWNIGPTHIQKVGLVEETKGEGKEGKKEKIIMKYFTSV
jgi:hypothetical protein